MGKGGIGRHRLAALSVVLLLALTSLAILFAANSLLRSRVTDGNASPAPALTGPTVSFGALGDFDGNSPNYPIAVTEMKRLANRGANFLLAVGDLGYNSDEQTWCSVIKTYFDNTVIVAGNHDTTQSGPGDINNAVIYCPFNLGVALVAGPNYGYGISYYFDYPAASPLVRVIMITAGVSSTQTTGENYDSGGAEYTWTVNAATSARSAGIPWVVVGVHKLCINAGSYGCEIGQSLWDALITAKVDLILTGHYHVYERSYQLAHSSTCTAVRDGSYNAACVADFDATMVKGAGIVQVTDGAGGESVYSIDTSGDGQYFPAYMGSNMNSQGKTQGWGAALFSLNATTLMGSTMFCPTGTTDSTGECPTAASTTFQDSFTISSGAAPPPPPANAAPTLTASYAAPNPATSGLPVDFGTIYTDADNDAPTHIRVVVLNSTGRNAYLQPFTSNSIWNLPIGSGAAYVAGNIQPATASGMTTDPDILVLTPTAPMTDVWENNDGWSGGDRCAAQGPVVTTVPIPTDFVVPGATSSDMPNNAAAFLMPDGHTLVQGQPFTRCAAGGIATITWIRSSDPTSDLLDLGFYGAHGGSMLSSIGGTIRLGELVPGGVIRHALKLQLYGLENYYYDSTTQGYRWPALAADSYASSSYGGSVPALRMGSLLALPASLNVDSLSLQTEPARILARTLQDYGGYIVDDTAWDVYAIGTEFGPAGKVEDEFQATWGYAMDRSSTTSPWSQDMSKIFQALAVVDNWDEAKWTGVAASGGTEGAGGGAPRVPWAPPFSCSTAHVTLESPTAGIHVHPGDSLTVAWSSSGSLQANSVSLSFSADGGATWGSPFATSQPLNGSTSWTVPSTLTSQARLRAVAKDDANNDVTGMSGLFVIESAPSGVVTMQSPAAGVHVHPDDSVTVSWTSSGSLQANSVAVSFSANGGATWDAPFATGLPLNGSTTWVVPNVLTSHAMLRAVAKDTGGSDVTGSSGQFVIEALPTGHVTLASPGTGAHFLGGASVTVTWNSSGSLQPNSVSLSFSADGGTSWDPPFATAQPVNGSTTWSVPYVTTDRAMLRATATDTNGAEVEGRSGLFVVEAGVPVARFTLSPAWPRPDHAVTFDASSSSASSLTATLEARWDWEDDGTWITGWSSTLTASHAFPAEGTYTVRLEVRDPSPFTANATRTISVDGTQPTFHATSPSGTVTNAQVLISWNATDALSPDVTYETSLDGGAFESRGSMTSMTLALGDGSHTVVVHATDEAGNLALAVISFRVDTNVFSFTGPYFGMPTLLAIAAVVAVGALLLRRRKNRT